MSHLLGYLLILLGLFFPEVWAQAQVTTANIYIPFAAGNGALQSALRASVVSSKDKTTVFAATCTAGPCTAIPGGSGTFTFTAGPETFVYSAAPNAQSSVDLRCTFKDCLTKPDIECTRTEVSSGSTTATTTTSESANLATLTLNHGVPSPTQSTCTTKKKTSSGGGSKKSKNKNKSEGVADRRPDLALLSVMAIAALVGAAAIVL